MRQKAIAQAVAEQAAAERIRRELTAAERDTRPDPNTTQEDVS